MALPLSSKIRKAGYLGFKGVKTSGADLYRKDVYDLAQKASEKTEFKNVILKRLQAGIEEETGGKLRGRLAKREAMKQYETIEKIKNSYIKKIDAKKEPEIQKERKNKSLMSAVAGIGEAMLKSKRLSKILRASEPAGSRLGVQGGYQARRDMGSTFAQGKISAEKKISFSKSSATTTGGYFGNAKNSRLSVDSNVGAGNSPISALGQRSAPSTGSFKTSPNIFPGRK